MQACGGHQTVEMVTAIRACINIVRGISCRLSQLHAMGPKIQGNTRLAKSEARSIFAYGLMKINNALVYTVH